MPPAAALSDDTAASTAGDAADGGRGTSGGVGKNAEGGVSGSGAWGGEGGDGPGALAGGMTAMGQVVHEEEEELRDFLSMRRPAEVGVWVRTALGESAVDL